MCLGKWQDWVVLQLPTVQGLINLALLDQLHGLLGVLDLHRNVLIMKLC